MFAHTRGPLPAGVLHLPRLRVALAVAIRLGRVVVVARLGFPRTHHLRVEGPVGNVDALDGIDERARLQAARREPLALVPTADLLAHRRFGEAERQQALGPDRRLDLLVIDQRRRAAELAALPDAIGVEHRHRLAALALDGALLRHPAALIVGHLAQRAHEIQLLDLPGLGDLVGGLGAAERAHEFLLTRVPLRLRAARRTGILVKSLYDHVGFGNLGIWRCGNLRDSGFHISTFTNFQITWQSIRRVR